MHPDNSLPHCIASIVCVFVFFRPAKDVGQTCCWGNRQAGNSSSALPTSSHLFFLPPTMFYPSLWPILSFFSSCPLYTIPLPPAMLAAILLLPFPTPPPPLKSHLPDHSLSLSFLFVWQRNTSNASYRDWR